MQKQKLSHSLRDFNTKIEGLSKLCDEIETKIQSGEFDNNTTEALKRFEFFLGATANFLATIHKSYKKDISVHINDQIKTNKIKKICEKFFLSKGK